jgi:hypothetical protein
MPRIGASIHNGAKRLLEDLGRVQALRLSNLMDRGEHTGYVLGSTLEDLAQPEEDGYSVLEKMAIARGYGHIVQAYHNR